MDADTLILAAFVVRSPHWRWMPGMLTRPESGRYTPTVRLCDDRRPGYPDEYDWPHDLGLRVPDLRDPATLGCLLALVREAWGDPGMSVVTYAFGSRWVVCRGRNTGDGLLIGDEHLTEPAALVAALFAAPEARS